MGVFLAGAAVNWPTACEMCSIELARWHQIAPVDRWLCVACAEQDQRSCKRRWHGEFIPMLSDDHELLSK